MKELVAGITDQITDLLTVGIHAAVEGGVDHAMAEMRRYTEEVRDN